jgi:beta-glucanase (GH16 family)
MGHTAARMRAVLMAAALAVSLTACGTAQPNPAAPVSGPDLYSALEPVPVDGTASGRALPPAKASAVQSSTSAPTSRPSTSDDEADEDDEATPRPELDWRLVGGDEFDGAALDDTAWQPYDSVGGFGTGLRRPEAISVSDGTLKITARGDVSGGMGHALDQLYGRWEFRVRTDPGRGFGSAVLLWPDSERWPEDGEVDIMEVPDENRDRAHFVLHWGEDNTIHGAAVPGDFTEWHTFAVEWLPDRVTWFVDGEQRYENTDPAAIPKTPMHLAVQLDQGPMPDWLPARDETTPEEVSLEVDWVRVYAL